MWWLLAITVNKVSGTGSPRFYGVFKNKFYINHAVLDKQTKKIKNVAVLLNKVGNNKSTCIDFTNFICIKRHVTSCNLLLSFIYPKFKLSCFVSHPNRKRIAEYQSK